MKPRLIVSILFLSVLGMFVLGCKPVEAPSRDDSTPNPEPVRLESLNWAAFQKKLTETGTAKMTLVDVWATTCVPCRKNFHHSVELHEKYASKGLRVISLSLDERDDPKAREVALRFLTGQKAAFTNILLDEESGVGFEKLNIVAIPAVFLYDSNGEEIERFTYDDPNNQFTYEQVEQAVAKRLDSADVPSK